MIDIKIHRLLQTFIGSIYFAVVPTMSTVGYGDLDATTSSSKVFTAFFMAFGVLVVYMPVSRTITHFQADAERKMTLMAEQRHGSGISEDLLSPADAMTTGDSSW